MSVCVYVSLYNSAYPALHMLACTETSEQAQCIRSSFLCSVLSPVVFFFSSSPDSWREATHWCAWRRQRVHLIIHQRGGRRGEGKINTEITHSQSGAAAAAGAPVTHRHLPQGLMLLLGHHLAARLLQDGLDGVVAVAHPTAAASPSRDPPTGAGATHGASSGGDLFTWDRSNPLH